MRSNFVKNRGPEASWFVIQPLSREDSTAVAAVAIGCRADERQGRRNRWPRSVQRHHGASRSPGGRDLRSRYSRRDIRLVGQAGTGPKGGRDYSRAWRLVQLGNGPGVPELRRPDRFERRCRCFHP